jgi:two-component system, LuxR family, response regulator FixJ
MGRRIEQSRDVVYIVEDDDAARSLFSTIARSMGLGCEAFASAAEFLLCCDALRPGCLVLDLVMPDVGGLALQRELILRGISIPIIFVTGKGQVATAVEAMRQGAFNLLEKPFPNSVLVENIERAIDLDHSHRRMLLRADAIREKLGSLTPREHDVLNQVICGRPNKIIAHDLNLSQRSIEMHRSRVMEKMGASSVAELVRMLVSVEPEQREGPPDNNQG